MQIIESKERIDKNAKILNYSNEGSTTWYNFAKKIIQIYGSKIKIEPVESEYFKDEVKRPKFTNTSKSKISQFFNLKIKEWEISLYHYIKKDLN